MTGYYYGIVRGSQVTFHSGVVASTSALEAVVGELDFLLGLPDQHIVMAGVGPMSADVGALLLATEYPPPHVMTAGSGAIAAEVGALTLDSSGIGETVILATASGIMAATGELELDSVGPVQHTIITIPAGIQGELGSLAFVSAAPSQQVLLAGGSVVSGTVGSLSLSSSPAAVLDISATGTAIGAAVGSLSLVADPPEATESILSATPSWVNAETGKVSLTSEGAGAFVLTGSATSLDAVVGMLGLTSNAPDSQIITAVGTGVLAATGALSLTSQTAGTHTLTGSGSQALAEVGALPLASDGAASYMVPGTASQAIAEVGTLLLVAEPPAAYVIAANSSAILAGTSNLSLTSDPVTGTGEAGCFHGDGYLHTGVLPVSDGFLAGTSAPHHGYVSVWYRYDPLTPNPNEAYEHMMVLFQSRLAPEGQGWDTEDCLEFGIGRQAGPDRPDLYMRRNDASGTEILWTFLDGDGGPDLYDGQWHHLVFGNEYRGAGGITGGRGWYFYVDGQAYEGEEIGVYTNAGVWFRHVQALSSLGINHQEVDHAASRIEIPQGQKRLWGCIDELMVVSNRDETTHHLLDGVNGDIAYLWNGGWGRTIPQVEAGHFKVHPADQAEHELWDDVHAAWQYRQADGMQFGHEYRDPYTDERYALSGSGYEITPVGIPGAQ